MPNCHMCSKSNLFNSKEIDIFRVKESLEDTNYQPHRICMNCIEKFEKKNNVQLTILGYYPYKSKKFVRLHSSQLAKVQQQFIEQRRLLLA